MTRFSNFLQANTKILQNHSLRLYKLKAYLSAKPTTEKKTSISLKQKKKLALSTNIKLDNIRVNFHEITINEKEVPSLKISDPTIEAVDRPDSRRAITTSSRNRQTLQNRQKYIKLRPPKLQLN